MSKHTIVVELSDELNDYLKEKAMQAIVNELGISAEDRVTDVPEINEAMCNPDNNERNPRPCVLSVACKEYGLYVKG